MGRWRVALRLVGVGWYVGLCIFLGVWGGLWLDKKFNTEPFLVIVGLVVGIILAFYGVYRMILPLMDNQQDKENS
jgi:ATP synthase protein I